MKTTRKPQPKPKPVDQLEELCNYLAEKTQACVAIAQNTKENKPRAYLVALLEMSILQSKIIMQIVAERKKER